MKFLEYEVNLDEFKLFVFIISFTIIIYLTLFLAVASLPR